MTCDAFLNANCSSDGPARMEACKDLARYSNLNRHHLHMRKASALCRRALSNRIWCVPLALSSTDRSPSTENLSNFHIRLFLNTTEATVKRVSARPLHDGVEEAF